MFSYFSGPSDGKGRDTGTHPGSLAPLQGSLPFWAHCPEKRETGTPMKQAQTLTVPDPTELCQNRTESLGSSETGGIDAI